jgi:hypothetical protein
MAYWAVRVPTAGEVPCITFSPLTGGPYVGSSKAVSVISG